MSDSPSTGELVLYQIEAGTRLYCRFVNGEVWLTQAAIAQLYATTPQNITMHLAAIYEEGELAPEATCKEFLQVRQEGKRQVRRSLQHYNLTAVLAVGYRVRSSRGTQFRQWATARLEEYVVKGFTMDDERLKQRDAGGYFDELLARIRDIRSSERVFWRKVLDIYATSVDYDPRAEASQQFFLTQTRTFTYSSLNRLISATNPESGTINYEYFAGGALKKRSEAATQRGASMEIPSIDGLKRPLAKNYTEAGTATTTPDVVYCYDGKMYVGGSCQTGTRPAPDYAKGRLTGYGSQVDGADASMNYSQIDALGRIVKSSQTVRTSAPTAAPTTTSYGFTYGYQASGAMTSVTYPSGKVVKYSYGMRDLASQVTEHASASAAGEVRLTAGQYEANGAMKSAKLGAAEVDQRGFKQAWKYNSKGQMTSVTARKFSTEELRFGQVVDYGTAGNNGNVWAQTISTGLADYQQYFRYDAANRLRLAVENPANVTQMDNVAATCGQIGGDWCERLGYDAFGNVWQTENVDGPALAANGPSWYYQSALPARVNNRLNGVDYDLAGNQTEYVPNGAPAAKYL